MAGGRVFHRTVNGKQQKTWTAQWDAPPDSTGKRKQKMKGGFKTKGEAQAFLATKLNEVNTGTYVEPSEQAFGEYLDYWLETYIKHNVQDTTFKQYYYIAELLKKQIGHLPLKKIDSKILQEQIKYLFEEGKKPTTIRNHFFILQGCLKQAVASELIPKNPMDKVKLPKRRSEIIRPATPEELQKILEAYSNTRYYELIYLAAMTGMRRGELLGLRWSDINFETGDLSISQTTKYLSGQGVTIRRGGKTKSSTRTIALSPETIRVLKKHKIKQLEEKLATGNSYYDHDLVFADDFGNPYQPNSISKHFKRYVNNLGLSHLHFHSLRHTHASFLLAMGENAKLVQERLGHENASTTLNI